MSGVFFPDGAIAVKRAALSEALYDAANHTCMAQFDGCGSIVRFSQIGQGDVLEPGFHYCVFQVDGLPLTEQIKTVTMIGKKQDVLIESPDITIFWTQFLDDKSKAVFTRYQFINPSETIKEISFSFGFQGSVPIALTAFPDLKVIEILANKHYYALQLTVPPNGRKDFYYMISKETAGHAKSGDFLQTFHAAENEARRYISVLQGMAREKHINLLNDKSYSHVCSANIAHNRQHGFTALSVKLRALYISCINCALSAYKEIPEENFKAFFAGISYQSPARTYYRDGYATVLCLLPIVPEWVKNQILTLARGVNRDGSCPSAVMASGQAFWPGHYDSPAFMIIMVYDYIRQTGDYALLDEEVGSRSLLSVLESCLDWLNNQTDETGLIYKPAGCRLDWADNVYREGYVTYIEALYARSVYAMAAFYERSGRRDQADALTERFERIKNAIHAWLWDEQQGYYVNYRSTDYCENNLSLDTVFCILFEIADESHARRHLQACRQYLEADFGVRCAAPFYRNQAHLVEKSAFPTRYHNGSDWPYLDGLYALALMRNGFGADHVLTGWFDYSLSQGWYTPVEYYSPAYGRGSFLQAWSSTPAYALQQVRINPNTSILRERCSDLLFIYDL